MALARGIPRRRAMDQRDVSRQVLVEHQILGHVIAALRATMSWRHQGDDFARKLQSLRFVGKSFKRHLKHLIALEEKDGYMAVVLASRPDLSDGVAALKGEHLQFRKSLHRILVRLDEMLPSDHQGFERASSDLGELLEQLEAHGKKETD